MRTSAELQIRAPREAPAPAAASGASTRIIPLRQPSASDRAAVREAVAGNAAPWRSPSDAVSTGDTIPSDWSSSYALYMAARSQRALVLGELAAVEVQAVAEAAHALVQRYRRMRRAAAAREALRQLDDRTLHDLGIDRSEIASIAAESAGAAEQSRTQVVRGPRSRASR
jgi:uncharacterized protein YjiS (DUF1127 family)